MASFGNSGTRVCGPSLRHRLVPVPSEFLQERSRGLDWPKRPELPRADLTPLVLHREPTDTEVWEHFEAEYRLPNRSPEFVRRQVENAKYGLDKAAFSMDRFVRNFRDAASFEFAQSTVRRARAKSLFTADLVAACKPHAVLE